MQPTNVFCFTLKDTNYIKSLLNGETERSNGGESVEDSVTLMQVFLGEDTVALHKCLLRSILLQ